MSAREARSRFAEITDRVHFTGEVVIVEKQGRPFVAVISLEDLQVLERFRAKDRQDRFRRAAAKAASETNSPPPSEDEIVEAVRKTREQIYRERYGAT